MKKIFGIVIAAMFMMMNCGAFAAYIPANTPVKIQSNYPYNSGSLKAGDVLSFSVVNDVTNNGRVVIAEGTKVSATVKNSVPRMRIGRPGELELSDFHTTAVDGTRVNLSSNVHEKATSHMKKSIILGAAIFPLFLLMRGEHAVIEQGKQYTVHTY